MRDESVDDPLGVVPLDSLGGLALEALKHLAVLRAADAGDINLACVDRFLTVLCEDWNDDPDAVIRSMAAMRVRLDALVWRYIPEAARNMGRRWEADEASFTEVTVCGARLHAVLRRIDDMMAPVASEHGPDILLLVPPDEHHTLGASVAASRLRAAGFSVCLRVGPSCAEVSQIVAGRRFDLVMLSVSCASGVAMAASLIKVLRLSGRNTTPVVVGGPVPMADVELLSATQADRVIRELSHVITEYGQAHLSDGLATS